jgi:hypothetical protein
VSQQVEDLVADSEFGAESSNGHRDRGQKGDILELLVKTAGLVVIILPLVGAGIRALAFALAGLPDPIALAADNSVASLAVTAIKAVGFLVAVVAALGFLAHRGWAKPYTGTRLSWRWYGKWQQRAVLVVSIGVIALLSVWPGGLLFFAVGGFAGWLIAEWQLRKLLSFYRIAVVVMLVGAISAVAAGLDGSAVGDQVNTYRFTSATGIPDGNYVPLGESNGIVFIDSCRGLGLVGVNTTEVSNFTSAPQHTASGQTLFNWIFRRGSLSVGYRRQC